jgi:uncharacterized SAM-binding protein YcdF (DUF218 family)
MSRRWRWFMIIVVAMGAVSVALYMARHRVLPAAADWLDVGAPPQPADVVMLLNGGENTRPFAAAALVKGGWAPLVVIAKVEPSPQAQRGMVLPDHEVNRQVLEFCGLHEDQIRLLDAAAESTLDEAMALRDFLDSAPNQRVLIVTDSPQTRRARWIFRRVLGNRAQWVAAVSTINEDCRPEDWWRNAKGFQFVAEEYIKLTLYHLRYGWLGYGLVFLAVALLGGIAWRGCHAKMPARR